MLPIAIQGFEGSFHQEAAQHYFGKNISIYPCKTFRELINTLSQNKKTKIGLMAIENAIAGSILPNYTLLNQSGLTVTGEIILQIKQQFITHPTATLKSITEVHSHPVAIQQCWTFLEKHNFKIVETEDTALSVKYISENKLYHIAGIGSINAAKMFKMKVLVSDIHTNKNNYTRFLVLEKKKLSTQGNKASIVFIAPHQKGSLSQVLIRMHYHGINLSKLQSFPLVEQSNNWNYHFYADLEFDHIDMLHKALADIKHIVKELKIYGIYNKGKVF